MNNRDKDQLSILLFIIAFIAITLVSIFGTQYIPTEMIIIAIIALKFLYLQPTVVSMFYKAHGQKAPITRFIPVYNEIMVLPEKNAVALLISYVLLGVSVALLFVPSEFILNILGERVALNYGVTVIRVIAFLFIANMIIYTISMCNFMRTIEGIYKKFLSMESVVLFKFYLKVLLLFPIIRIVPLITIYNKLFTLSKLNNYNSNINTGFELKEEK